MEPTNSRWRKSHVEVPLFFCFFCYTISSSVTQNLVIYKTCYVILEYNQTECALLGSAYSDNYTIWLEQKVEPDASIILMTLNLVESLLTPLFCFILGPWSDKYGRKPILLSSLIGFTLSSIVLIVISLLPNISPWFLVLKSLPVIFSGGFCAYFTATLSYISDVTTEENRGFRLAVFEGILILGATAGTLFGPWLFFATNYLTVYVVSTLFLIVATLFSYCCIPESVLNPTNEGGFLALFDFSFVNGAFATTFKRREHRNRWIVLIILILLTTFSIIFNTDSVFFLYFRDKFHWSLEKYSEYNSIAGLLWMIGLVITSYFLHKLLHIPEIPLILISLVCLVISYLIQAAANQDWQIYLSMSIRMWAASIAPLSRSILTKVISTDENGKVFCVITAFEGISKIFATPLYTFVYNETLVTFPGAFNLLSVGFMVVATTLVAIMYPLYKTHQRSHYDVLNGENSNVNN